MVLMKMMKIIIFLGENDKLKDLRTLVQLWKIWILEIS